MGVGALEEDTTESAWDSHHRGVIGSLPGHVMSERRWKGAGWGGDGAFTDSVHLLSEDWPECWEGPLHQQRREATQGPGWRRRDTQPGGQ